MIKAVIFDLWETLGTKNVGISKTLMNYFNIDKSPNFMVKYESSIQLDAWQNETDMSSNFLKSFDLPITKQNLEFVANTLRSGIEKATLYDGMEQLLRELKPKYKLAILSNTTIFESQVPKRWGIDNLFDTQIYSWRIKSLKPSKANFDTVCSYLNLTPSECVFIDDGEKNVVSAHDYGFKAVKYENMTQLRQDLKKLGVMLDD